MIWARKQNSSWLSLACNQELQAEVRKHLRLHRVSVLELEQLFAVALDAEVGLVGQGSRREGASTYNAGKTGKPELKECME